VQLLAFIYKELSTAEHRVRATSMGKGFGALATAGRSVRISPDTGDGSREAGAGRDGDGGGEAEDPAEGRARTGHPGSEIGVTQKQQIGPFFFNKTFSAALLSCHGGRAVSLLSLSLSLYIYISFG